MSINKLNIFYIFTLRGDVNNKLIIIKLFSKITIKTITYYKTCFIIYLIQNLYYNISNTKPVLQEIYNRAYVSLLRIPNKHVIKN